MKLGPKFKICRRLGPGVFEQCQTPRFTRAEGRGRKQKQGGRGGMGGKSDYGAQLLEKQRVRFTYRLNEKQFANYVKRAVSVAGASTQALYQTLESRLDSAVYRLGFAHTRALARQLVSHGHITVNGRRVTIPSYQLSVGDRIGLREGSRSGALFAGLDERYKEYTPPRWLRLDTEKKEGTVETLPQFSSLETPLNLQSVVEFYSR